MDFTLQVEKPGHREVAAGVDAAGQVFWLLTTRFLQIHPDPVNLFLFLCYTSFVHYNLKLRFIYDSSDRTQTSQLWSFYTRFLFLIVFLLSSHWAPTSQCHPRTARLQQGAALAHWPVSFPNPRRGMLLHALQMHGLRRWHVCQPGQLEVWLSPCTSVIRRVLCLMKICPVPAADLQTG